jgi:hypothetical protein
MIRGLCAPSPGAALTRLYTLRFPPCQPPGQPKGPLSRAMACTAAAPLRAEGHLRPLCTGGSERCNCRAAGKRARDDVTQGSAQQRSSSAPRGTRAGAKPLPQPRKRPSGIEWDDRMDRSGRHASTAQHADLAAHRRRTWPHVRGAAAPREETRGSAPMTPRAICVPASERPVEARARHRQLCSVGVHRCAAEASQSEAALAEKGI